VVVAYFKISRPAEASKNHEKLIQDSQHLAGFRALHFLDLSQKRLSLRRLVLRYSFNSWIGVTSKKMTWLLILSCACSEEGIDYLMNLILTNIS
jgi:hypothetical protein